MSGSLCRLTIHTRIDKRNTLVYEELLRAYMSAVRWDNDGSREGRTSRQTASYAADTAWVLFLCV